MRNILRYSLLITLTLLITAGLVNTQLFNAQPVPIGTAKQARPYESHPTQITEGVDVTGMPGPATDVVWGAESDGDLSSSVSFRGNNTSTTFYAQVEFHNFTDTPPTPFNIGWVDLKIKYKHPGLGDAIWVAYNTNGDPYVYSLELISYASGTGAKFDMNGNPAVRPWANPTTSSGNPWTWLDVQNLRIYFYFDTYDNGVWDSWIDVFEIWLTIYESPPPSLSTAMSVMPGASNVSIVGLLPGTYFFVDVYVNGLSGSPGLWGYQATIKYDANIVNATQWFTYWPFITHAASGVGLGNVSVSYYTYGGDSVGFTGTATPLCRIYFQVLAGGATPLDLIDDRSAVPPLVSELKPVGVAGYTPPLHDGWFSANIHLSGPGLIDLTTPLTTLWHEDYPNWSELWHLTSWEDGQEEFEPGYGKLSECDQIDMTNETGWTYWFHVDNVTITIHWTVKESESGPLTEEVGAAEPEDPELTAPLGDPTGSLWHMIYPDYCKTIKITSWEDTGEIGVFDPSDQFDFEFIPSDTLIGGTEPPPGASLTTPGALDKYYDQNFNNILDVGETVARDTNNNGIFDFGDVVLVGPALNPTPPPEPLKPLPSTIMYYDAGGTVGVWDVGEAAVDDVDGSGTYNPAEVFWAHLDDVTTDIIVSQKPIPPEYTGPVPEFPLGITLLLLIAPIIPLAYLWRLRKKVPKQ